MSIGKRTAPLFVRHSNILYHHSRFECKVCNKRIRCDHMGKREVIKHTETQSHKDLAKTFQFQARLQFSTPSLNETQQRLRAELKWQS